MNDNAQYPPPDFDCRLQNAIAQPPTFQPPPRSSSFHPSMWSWGQAPPSFWDPRGQAGQGTGPSDSGQGTGPWDSRSWDSHGGRPDGPAYPPRPRGPHHQQWHRGGHRGGRQSFRQFNNQEKRQRNKKEPEYAYFCDTCDRGFAIQEKYEEHISQHVKCSVPDCNFTAHEKIVNIHWRNSHGPGGRRVKLDTPEEIARWREERRKNFPTLNNIAKKRKIQVVREAGGGVLDTAQFGRMRVQGSHRFQGAVPTGPLNPGVAASAQPPPPRAGDPLGALVHSDPDSDREEPAGNSTPSALVVAPKQMSSGLAALVASYGSMTESDSDSEPEALPIQRASRLVQENQALLRALPPRAQGAGSSPGPRPSSWCKDTHQGRLGASDPTPDRGGRGRGSRGRGRGGRGGRRGRRGMEPQRRRNTLLEMLLAPDIRHERNVLLQCVRYVVRNRFFGLERCAQTRVEVGGETAREDATQDPTRAAPVAREGGHQAGSASTPSRERTGSGQARDGEAAERQVDRPACGEEGAVPQHGRASQPGPGVHSEAVAPADFTQNATAGAQQTLIQAAARGRGSSATETAVSYPVMCDDEVWESAVPDL